MNKLISLNKVEKHINEESLKQIELELNLNIYFEFKKVLINYNVAKPLYSYYNKDNLIFNLDYLLGFSSKEFEDFKSVYNIYLNRIPENMIPIGIVDGADLLCMDNKTGEIYYWFHEEDDWGLEGNEKYPAQVGQSLSFFLDLLKPNEKPTKFEIEKAINNSTVKITPASVKIRNEQREKQGLPPLTLEEWYKKLNNIN